ncbi:dTDP-4-dehydrorhamnose reductase [Bacteroidota bacterium]
MISILITGAKGQLGNEIKKILPDFPGMSFLFTDVDELDITNAAAVKDYLNANQVQYLVNCAAYTAVDKAEDDSELAGKINASAVEILATETKRRNIQLIHISTDYIFDGEKNHPYREDDPVNPCTVYGQSKLAGETAIRKSGNGIIIRTSWLYSEFGNNFVKTILRLSRDNKPLKVVFDQTGCPTYARDLAIAILEMIRNDHGKGQKSIYNVYHYSNTGICSWYEFAESILKLSGSVCRVEPVESKDFPTRAARPRYSVLDKSKLLGDYPLSIPHWKDSLEDCLKELKNK